SDYKLPRNGHVVRIIFCEKAEAQCMPVALASMLSKYLREALMGRFNAYWKTMLPELAPTAGYYGDGSRFLQDIDAKRRELGIEDSQLIRSREASPAPLVTSFWARRRGSGGGGR